MKEDIVWPHEWYTLDSFTSGLDTWIKNYNEDFPHSSLGYLTPTEFEQKYAA